MIPAVKELRVKASFQWELRLVSSVPYWVVSGFHTFSHLKLGLPSP